MQNESEKQGERFESRPKQDFGGIEREPSEETAEGLMERNSELGEYEDVRTHLEKKADQMEVTPQLREDIKAYAKAGGGVLRLLEIADTKGIPFTIKVAEKMKNPHLLDQLHDALAKDNYYKKYLD